MSDLKRTYTADQLEALGLPWENYLARDSEDEHRWYINWRIIFRDPADDTTWSIIKTENKNENGELSWWYSYGSSGEIVAWRVEAREVTVTQRFEVKADADAAAVTA